MMQCWQWNAVHEGTRLCSVDNEMMLFMKAPTMQCWQWNDAIDEGTTQWHDAVLTMKWCSVDNKRMLSMRAPTMQSWQWNKAVHEGNRLCGVDNKMMHCWQWNDAVHERTGLCSVDNEMMQCWQCQSNEAVHEGTDYAVLTMKWCSVDNKMMQCWQWNDDVHEGTRRCSVDSEMMLYMKALDVVCTCACVPWQNYWDKWNSVLSSSLMQIKIERQL